MKWFKHQANERDQLASKLIRRKFGAEGYGIYQALKEVIAENVEPENIQDWGSVDANHEIETLADECATTPERLKEFLHFCNSKKIFEKRNGKLFCEKMLEELDDYSTRIRNGLKNGGGTEKLRSKSEKVMPKLELEQEEEQDNTVSIEKTVLKKLPDITEDKDYITYLADDISKALGDTHSGKFFKLVAAKVPEKVIRETLSEIKTDGAKNPAKVFTYRMNRYAIGHI